MGTFSPGSQSALACDDTNLAHPVTLEYVVTLAKHPGCSGSGSLIVVLRM